MRATVLSFALALVAGCPKQDAGAVAAAPSGPAADVPGDAASRAFAEALMGNPLQSFSPDDGGGASFSWKKVEFSGGNTWTATSVLSAGGEDVDCEESGKWSMEAAESATRATVVLQTAQSSCPGRAQDKQYRLLMTREGGGWQVLFR